MGIRSSLQQLTGLLEELRAHPHETEWLEFKTSVANPQDIGEYLSAISNAAALADVPYGYVVWGVDDTTHKVVGTTFKPHKAKKGNEGLMNWLSRQIEPGVDFHFHEFTVRGKAVVLLEIPRAQRHPVRCGGEGYIRIGSHKRKLRDLPEKERALWRALDTTPFEQLIAKEHASADEVLGLLDYPGYFRLMKMPLPAAKKGILDALQADGLIIAAAGAWNITTLAAVLFAVDLSKFRPLARKTLRIIAYEGNSKAGKSRETINQQGYASGFEGYIEHIMQMVPSHEEIIGAVRQTVGGYPPLAVRELVANALIHQDLSVTGAGPMVEVYADRIEISNPGAPLNDTNRFMDLPPQSRNEGMGALMRRMGLAEERGSGVDKVISEIERYRLPPALFEARGNNTVVILFAAKPLTRMTKKDRVRAIYQHASLCYVTQQDMTNTSVRERFGISKSNAPLASRLIKEALDAKLIVLADEEAGNRARRYVPYWAA